MIISPKELIVRAHLLGMHQDGYIHPECSSCFNALLDEYRNACHAVLRRIGEDARIEAFDQFLTDLSAENTHAAWIFHDEPAILVAEFLGAPVDGNGEWEMSPTWKKIEAVLGTMHHEAGGHPRP